MKGTTQGAESSTQNLDPRMQLPLLKRRSRMVSGYATQRGLERYRSKDARTKGKADERDDQDGWMDVAPFCSTLFFWYFFFFWASHASAAREVPYCIFHDDHNHNDADAQPRRPRRPWSTAPLSTALVGRLLALKTLLTIMDLSMDSSRRADQLSKFSIEKKNYPPTAVYAAGVSASARFPFFKKAKWVMGIPESILCH